MFHFAFDPTKGILTVSVSGSWTLEEVDRYAREAGPAFERAREKAGFLRLFIDLGGAHVLSQTLMDPLAKAGMQYSRPDDRVALAVASTLLKLQMRRMLGDAPVPIFLAADEAEEWLQGSDSAPARAVG